MPHRKHRQKPNPADPLPMTDVWDMTGRYGTYNIQPTADTDQTYPAIAQGFPGETKEKRKDSRP